MELNPETVASLTRIGGSFEEGKIDWPQGGRFHSSLDRIRDLFPELRELDEFELEDHIRPVRELTFVKDPSVGFWEGWEVEFGGIDLGRFIPFSSDEAYFYFIDKTSADLKVAHVDHETVDEAPYHSQGNTLEQFLSILEMLPPSRINDPSRLP